MLTDIETGYEGRFDFPARHQGPGRTYLLASVPRAGSTFFSHLLWRTGYLGAPLEYLNFEPAGPYGFAAASPQLQHQLWRSVLRRHVDVTNDLAERAGVVDHDPLSLLGG